MPCALKLPYLRSTTVRKVLNFFFETNAATSLLENEEKMQDPSSSNVLIMENFHEHASNLRWTEVGAALPFSHQDTTKHIRR